MPKKNFTFLDKKQTAFYKGLAIIMILFHNFFHLVSPGRCENEFNFDKNCGITFVNNFSFGESINLLSSFLGYYGVYVFIFLSGYGLTKAFQSYLDKPYKFVLRHIIKVYLLFLLSAGIFVIYMGDRVNYTNLFYTLMLTNNFSADTLFRLVGPWWFFSLIIQLYILFLLLFYLLKKHISSFFYISFIVFVLAEYIVFYAPKNFVFFANSLAHLPEFMLGILIAFYERKFTFLHHKNTYLYLAIISLSLLFAAQTWKIFFVFGYISFVVFVFSICRYIGWQKNSFLEFSGKISPYLFGINGFLGRNIFVYYANFFDNSALKLFCCLTWLILIYIIAIVCSKFISIKSTLAILKL